MADDEDDDEDSTAVVNGSCLRHYGPASLDGSPTGSSEKRVGREAEDKVAPQASSAYERCKLPRSSEALPTACGMLSGMLFRAMTSHEGALGVLDSHTKQIQMDPANAAT